MGWWSGSYRYCLIKCAQELEDNVLEFGVGCITDCSLGGDCLKESLLVGFYVLQEFLFEFGDLGGIHLVQESTDTAVNDGNLE